MKLFQKQKDFDWGCLITLGIIAGIVLGIILINRSEFVQWRKAIKSGNVRTYNSYIRNHPRGSRLIEAEAYLRNKKPS